MTAPNPVMNANRPATAEAATGQETASHLTTTSARAITAYRTAPWLTWDHVQVSVNPELAAETTDVLLVCDWCGGDDGCLAEVRVHGPWPQALDVGWTCAETVIAHALDLDPTVTVQVETA